MKLGRRRTPAGHHTLARKLARFCVGPLPTPPDAVDFTVDAATCLGQMYLNDKLGDCVCASGNHMLGAWTANAGAPFVATDAQVLADYEAIGGYNPADPSTDQGCDLGTAIDYWTSHGFADGTKLAGSVSVDATNLVEVKTALWLFGGLFTGVELAAAWLSNPDVWDVAGPPVPEDGHGIPFLAYDADGITLASWGTLRKSPWAAVQQYWASTAGGELHALLSPDMILRATGLAPSGLDMGALTADLPGVGMVVVP